MCININKFWVTGENLFVVYMTAVIGHSRFQYSHIICVVLVCHTKQSTWRIDRTGGKYVFVTLIDKINIFFLCLIL